MLKKIMKAALAASLVFGFSSMATADVKVNGDVKAYFGQYNSGADDYTAHFINVSEGHINVTGKSGPVSLFLQLESRGDTHTEVTYEDAAGDDQEISNSKNNVNNAQLAATYTTGALSVKVGTVATNAGCAIGSFGGLSSSVTNAIGSIDSCLGYTEQDGIQVKYAIPALKGAAMLTIEPSTGGQNMALNLVGMSGPVYFSIQSLSKVTDKYSDADDTAYTDSVMTIGAKVFLGKMAVSVDMNSFAKDSANAAAYETKLADTILAFSMADLGPGTLVVSYQTQKKSTSEELAAYGDKDTVWTNLVYKMGLAKGAALEAFYLSKAETPLDGDTTTQTAFGAGLVANF